jgi:hypothetical protein
MAAFGGHFLMVSRHMPSRLALSTICRAAPGPNVAPQQRAGVSLAELILEIARLLIFP